jgi:hypothetical protein
MQGTNVKILISWVAVFLTLLYVLPHLCYNLLYTPQFCYSYYPALPSDVHITLFVLQCVLCITVFVLLSVIHLMLHCHLMYTPPSLCYSVFYASQCLCCYLLYTLCCIAIWCTHHPLCVTVCFMHHSVCVVICYTPYAAFPSDICITILCCQPLCASPYCVANCYTHHNIVLPTVIHIMLCCYLIYALHSCL